MQARVANSQDVTYVALIGFLDYETAVPFRKTCFDLLVDKKVVFDLKELSFVGSSGISPFLDVLKEFSEKAQNLPRFCGLSSEFKRIFAASEFQRLVVYETAQLAGQSFAEDITPSLLVQPEIEEDWIEEGVDAAVSSSFDGSVSEDVKSVPRIEKPD